MESRKLDEANWDKRPVSSNRGFNPLVHIAKFIEEIFPNFETGFFVKEDLEDRKIHEGYETLLKSDLEDLDRWNDANAERFSIVPNGVDGKLMWEDNYLCIRPKKWGDLRRRQVMYESQVRYNAARRGKAADIQQQLGARGLALGSELVESANPMPPEIFSEGEDKKDVYQNAIQERNDAQQKLVVDMQNMPRGPQPGPQTENARRGRGRPKGSHNKPKD